MKHIYYRIGPHLMSIYNRNNRFFLPRVEALMPSLQPFQLDACPVGERPLFVVHLTDEYSTGRAHLTETNQFEWDQAQMVVSRVEEEAHTLEPPKSTKRETYELAFTLRGGYEGRYRMLLDFRTRRVTIELSASLQTPTDSFLLNSCLMMAYAFFTVHKQTLVMHGSVVIKGGRGYLFLGRSGVGKSTHSRLWLSTLPGTELLNDDNPIVHYDRVTKTATVYGSPWSGKTPCYRAEHVPVGAFVRLAQAPENRIYRVKEGQAMAQLMPSCSSFPDDFTLYCHFLDTVTGLADYLPVFLLECLPDEAAAKLCHRAVSR